MKKTALIVAFVGIVVLLATGGITLLKSQKSLPSATQVAVSPDIMYITNPVNSFSGKIEKVEADTIEVSQQFTQNFSPPAVVTPGQTFPTPATKSLKYKVKITKNTQISQPPVSVPYLFNTNVIPTPGKSSVKNLVAGQYVNITSNADLRTIATYEFE